METLQGIPASGGIAIAPGFIYASGVSAPIKRCISDVDQELEHLRSAQGTAEAELDAIYQNAVRSIGQEEAEIFHAQMLMVKDPDLTDAVVAKIGGERINADAAFFEAAESHARELEQLPDEYFRARAADVRDIAARVVRILQHGGSRHVELTRKSIVLADDLAPSDTMQFERAFIAGFFTARGGTTSHTAILSRSLGVPAVVGGSAIPTRLSDSGLLILDGDNGRLIIDPDVPTLDKYRRLQAQQLKSVDLDRSAALTPAITKDNKHIQVVANIGNLADATSSITNGAEGVGLLRTEFSYIEKNLVPTEEEMVAAYRDIFHTYGGYPVVARTLDIGGDKEIPHLKLPLEANPFLGCRGIRLCFARPDLFRPQLRAILRAGVGTNLCIMFPMVATVGEVRQARGILNECMAELLSEDLPYNPRPQVGIMIEVPAAAVCADQLAREVDFFSIGTNDLTQYTLAVDRTNPGLSYLVSALQPAVLRLIKQVIDSGHLAGIWVGMCGELAGEPLAIPILLGLGLDEFSMNSPAIPRAKKTLRQWDTREAQSLAEKAIHCETPQEVEKLVKDWGQAN